MRSAQDRADLWRDAKSCETSAGVRGVLELGAALPELSALATELDVNPYLLNTPGGTLDLSTGMTHPCSPGELLTKVTGCPYEPGASSSGAHGSGVARRAGFRAGTISSGTVSSEWDTFLAATLP